jgi:K+-sensing histidine kinase KdpD
VDNALKFSRNAENRIVEMGCQLADERSVRVSVRDYGPGILRNQMKKALGFVSRSGNELTRETVGTGIGPALVCQLPLVTNGRIDVVNRNPGTELQMSFPAAPLSPSPERRERLG